MGEGPFRGSEERAFTRKFTLSRRHPLPDSYFPTAARRASQTGKVDGSQCAHDESHLLAEKKGTGRENRARQSLAQILFAFPSKRAIIPPSGRSANPMNWRILNIDWYED